MERRELVKTAIAHKQTERVPYCISFTPDGEKRLQELIGERSAKEFADNDITWTGHGEKLIWPQIEEILLKRGLVKQEDLKWLKQK